MRGYIVNNDNIFLRLQKIFGFSLWLFSNIFVTMFSFDGQYKSRRVVSLGGASKKVFLRRFCSYKFVYITAYHAEMSSCHVLCFYHRNRAYRYNLYPDERK